MKTEKEAGVTRREFLSASLAAPALFLFDGAHGLEAFAGTREVAPTPACGDGEDITPAQGAGPFFKPRSPERRSLVEPRVEGDRIVLQGRVLSTRCKPVPRALVDFWHADASGVYDNSGYRFRGHQFTDAEGRYRVETVVPGLYLGRTRHFHVRVQVPNRSILTTQLYFPGEAGNKSDGIFNPKLLISLRDSVPVKSATFDFVLDIG